MNLGFGVTRSSKRRFGPTNIQVDRVALMNEFTRYSTGWEVVSDQSAIKANRDPWANVQYLSPSRCRNEGIRAALPLGRLSVRNSTARRVLQGCPVFATNTHVDPSAMTDDEGGGLEFLSCGSI